MSELSPVDPYNQRLADQVFKAGQVIRSQEQALRRKLTEQAEKASSRELSPEVQLAGEVERLRDRMVWLHEHPKMRRFIGRSALGIVYKNNRSAGYPDTLSTEPLTDGEISQLRGEHLLFSGVVVWCFYDKYEKLRLQREQELFKAFGVTHERRVMRELYIDEQVKDVTTGATGNRRLYRLRTYSTGTGAHVEAHSRDGRFEEYASERRRELTAQYEAKHPWAQDWQPEGKGTDVRYTNPGWGWAAFEKLQQLERLNDELVPNLKPGTSWEFPDEFFLEPLGLVREMNLLLGTKIPREVVQ